MPPHGSRAFAAVAEPPFRLGEMVYVALVLSIIAVATAALALRRTLADRRPRPDEELPTDVPGLRGEVQALRVEAADAFKHLAVVRYDAFGDMGGHLSWSLALLDDHGDGVVLTSIHGRSDSRTYAKNVAGWKCDAALSPEEEEAVSLARAG